MASSRSTILEYLRNTLLPTITTGNGYNNTVVNVYRGFRNIDEMGDSDFPSLFITMPHERRKRITGNQFRSDLEVIVFGYVKNSKVDLSSSPTGVELDLDNLIEDMTKCIETDPIQGGRVYNTEITDIVTVGIDTAPTAGVAFSVNFSYAAEGVAP